jgi:putative addiction module component (TIGR02574 family)
MSEMMTSLSSLTPAEKLDLIGELWDDLSANPGDVPLTEAHMQELDRRKAAFDANPESGMTWEQVKQSILSRHGH